MSLFNFIKKYYRIWFSTNCFSKLTPSSYPTYPGGAPINLDTLYFSIYSLISILTILLSSSNKFCAKAFANSVLPTPVGPKNRKEPIGLLGSFMPALDLIIDSVIFVTASSCPMTVCEVAYQDEVFFLFLFP